MGLLDKSPGRDQPVQPQQSPSPRHAAPSTDEQAIARYRYMLQTAPPQTLEQAHTEAFAKLTPTQRNLLLQELSAALPEAERAAIHGAPQDDPHALARLATRAEIRQPGTLERRFNAMGAPGPGMGGLLAGSFLASVAGVVIGSAIAQSFFSDAGPGELAGADAGAFGSSPDADALMADASDAGDADFDMGWLDVI